MKNRNYIIRFALVFITGIILVRLTYQLKYYTFLFEFLIFGVPAIVGIIFWTWSIFTDFKNYWTNRKIVNLITPIFGLIFISIITILSWTIKSTFNKPSLLKIYYNGDFNGVMIDFKIDGTYIYDNQAIGLSEFQYGTYEINESSITLDKNDLDNVINSDRLEIRQKMFISSYRTETDNYIYQVNEKGEILKNSIEFRVVIDNRTTKYK